MRASAVVLAVALAFVAPSAHATMSHFEGFEDPAWVPGGMNWVNFLDGEIERVASGTDGITSSSGGAHARIVNILGGGAGGPYTFFGNNSSDFGAGFTASLDIYLDPAAWNDEDGFDYSVAVNNQAGDHLSDFVAHLGMINTNLVFNASTVTEFAYNEFKLENENGGNNYTIASTGWYTFQHVFYDDGGLLSVDINLLDDNGVLLHSITRMTSEPIATAVGGNRYGFLAYNNIEGLAIDNTRLTPAAAVPEPATIALLGAGLAGMGFLSRRRRRVD